MADLRPQQPSIRIRRQTSAADVRPSETGLAGNRNSDGLLQVPGAGDGVTGRRRSSSAASRLGRRISAYLPRSDEPVQLPAESTEVTAGPASSATTEGVAVHKPLPDLPEGVVVADGSGEYESNLVDFLDLIDPEVQTLSTLTNVQNSLFVPDLGRFINRRPSYILTKAQIDSDLESLERPEASTAEERPAGLERTKTLDTLASITSRQTARHYAVLPHGVRLQGWTEEDRKELDDHVRHMLHSKRSKFKRSMKGFGQYVRRPLGFFITLYATLITLFGLTWVLFLIGWINVGGRRYYIINVVDNILVALFAVMGDGLAPFRCVDTYHMIFIAHYHHLTWRLRREKKLPKLQDRNDLPPLPPIGSVECEARKEELGASDIEAQDFELAAELERRRKAAGDAEFEPDEDQFSVLTVKQQRNLVHHQKKFSRSHTFYKPHETFTHHAFPLRLLVAIVVLLDCHSLLQISLGTCTWAISYHHRPFALTTVILCCSITVNITAGILISVGDHKTRKKDVLDKLHRQELTAEAVKHLEKKKEKARKETPRGSGSSKLGHTGSLGVEEKNELQGEKQRKSLEMTRMVGMGRESEEIQRPRRALPSIHTPHP